MVQLHCMISDSYISVFWVSQWATDIFVVTKSNGKTVSFKRRIFCTNRLKCVYPLFNLQGANELDTDDYRVVEKDQFKIKIITTLCNLNCTVSYKESVQI